MEQPAHPTESGAPPAIAARPWTTGVGPHLIGLVLLIVFYDQLPPMTLAVGGWLASLAGVAAGAGLAYLLLYRGPALAGRRTGQTLDSLAACTLGELAARRLLGPVVILVAICWFAVALHYAVALSLRGLVASRLIEPSALRPLDGLGGALHGPAFLATLAVWSLSAAVLGPLLIRIVSAILYAYNVLLALVFGGLMLAFAGGLSSYVPPRPDGPVRLTAFTAGAQFVFGYLAVAGLGAAGWGRASATDRDVRHGGLIGIALAPIIVAAIASLTVAGALGRLRAELSEDEAAPPPAAPASEADLGSSPYAYQSVPLRSVGGLAGFGLTMALSLTLLGPCCVAPTEAAARLCTLVPGVPARAWPVVIAAAAWIPAATGWAGRLPLVFGLLGALVAPLLGAVTADLMRAPGAVRHSPSPSVRPAGLIAWFAGLCTGLIPYAGPHLGWPGAAQVQPASVLAGAVGFLVAWLLGALDRRQDRLNPAPAPQ